MKTIRLVFSVVSIIVLSSALGFNSCGGSGDKNASLPDPLVGISITGDASQFRQVIATIEKIQIINAESGISCDVISAPISINLADLAKVMQLSNLAQCAEGAYNRIKIELDKSAQLISTSSGTITRTVSLCSFASYQDEENAIHALQCAGPLCSLEISAAVNVVVKQDNRFALEFDISDVVNLSDPPTCGLTVKVSHLDETKINALAYPEAVTGLVSDISTSSRTFSLMRGNATVTVDYSAITPDRQPGLDNLLQLASVHNLRVKVFSPKVGMMRETIMATDVFVKVEGIFSSQDRANSFLTLLPRPGQTVTIDYHTAELNGMPAENGWVSVRLYGSDGMNYLASRVTVEPSGLSSDG